MPGIPKRGRPVNPEMREKNRRALVDAALEEFTQRGFSEARVTDIARRAGVAKGTVYLYFDSKESLFEGMLRVLITNPFDAPDAPVLQDNERVVDYLRRTLVPAFRAMEGSPRTRIMHLLMAEGARFPVLTQSYHRIVVEPSMQRIQALIMLAVKRGEISGDTLQRYPMLVFAASLMGMNWNAIFAGLGKIDVAAVTDSYLELIFRNA